jgi:hypothetical protein
VTIFFVHLGQTMGENSLQHSSENTVKSLVLEEISLHYMPHNKMVWLREETRV